MIQLKSSGTSAERVKAKPLNGMDVPDPGKAYREKYIELMEALFPVVFDSDAFTRIVTLSNNLFNARRGALFWFKDGKFTRAPELKAGINFNAEEISNPRFKSSFELILAAFRKKQYVVDTFKAKDRTVDCENSFCSAVSLPLKIKGGCHAVLYHDLFHTGKESDFFYSDKELVKRIIHQLSSYVEYGLGHRPAEKNRKNKASKNDKEAFSANQSILYQSEVMRKLIREADRAALSDTSVLIVGETGVGKELLARRIHNSSLRKAKPFVTINATTIPEGLFESELFGHEKGSFTGAERQKKGLIEVADGGTLFIDEVGEMPLHMQVKLLRAIQEKTFYRVGGTQTIHSDFRLVTATNSDLMLEACEGRFREDLYYRLNLFSFTIPPLIDRREDILLIAESYLAYYTRKYGKENLSLDSCEKKKLLDYAWPGNIRELKNVIEKSVIMVSSGENLKVNIPANQSGMNTRSPFADEPTLDEINRRYILHVLKKTKGKISGPGGAAELLDIGRTTLTARMKRLGLK